MSYTEIDKKTWRRATEFRFFSTVAAAEISATVTVDVTHLFNVCREKNVKFTAAFLWLVSDGVNRQEEFRMGMKEEKLVLYDAVHPSFSIFHDDDKTMSNLWVSYQPFPAFYAEYCRVTETYGKEKRFFARRDAFTPENTFIASSFPWLNFTHFSSHNLNNAPRFFPSVEWGKFTEENGKRTMPVSFTVHHAVADGYHMATFFSDLQEGCNTFDCEGLA